TVIPCTPTTERRSFTASSLKGLMIASTRFMPETQARLRPAGRNRRSGPSPNLTSARAHATGSDCTIKIVAALDGMAVPSRRGKRSTMSVDDSPRALIAWTVTLVVAAIALAWALYLIRQVLVLVYVSVLLAIGFSPLVRLVERQQVLPIGTRIPR